MNNRFVDSGIVTILVAVLLAGCSSLGPAHYRTYITEHTDPVDIVYRGLRLRSGQFIVGDEGDADTLLMSLLSEEYSPFVHAGVIVIENNRPYVYDGYVTVSMFMHASQGKPVGGGIRRATLEEYIGSQRIAAIFEPPAAIDKARVAEFAQVRHRDGTSFDIRFDWSDHSSLYCTEFVAVALHAGGGSWPKLDKVRANPSLEAVLEWLKVDTREIVTAQSLIRDAHRIALISRDYSFEQLTAYFAAKRELHTRFTDDQKLGNVWQWTWHGLALHPNVTAFLQASSERPNESATHLANEFFGAQTNK